MSFGDTLDILTDWFLILAGALLIFKALIAIDVALARYIVAVSGVILFGFGVMYRRRRLKRTPCNAKK